MSPTFQPLPLRFYQRDAELVARDLLGAYLVSECGGARCVGRIVETEAYPGPHDPASHAAESIGRTARNDPMFGPAGSAYIHLNFGVHWCLNAVVRSPGYPAAVLIRAVEPVQGIEVMRTRRPGRSDRELTSGPGRLTRALGIGPALQGHCLTEAPLFIAQGEKLRPGDVVRTARVGLSKGVDSPWRFYDTRSNWVSRPARPKAPSAPR